MSELTDVFGDWMTDAITVQTSLGQSGYGEQYADAVALPSAEHPMAVMVTSTSKRVRQSDGNEAVATVQILTEIDDLPMFTLGTLVTLATGAQHTVMQVNPDDHELAGLVVLCV